MPKFKISEVDVADARLQPQARTMLRLLLARYHDYVARHQGGLYGDDMHQRAHAMGMALRDCWRQLGPPGGGLRHRLLQSPLKARIWPRCNKRLACLHWLRVKCFTTLVNSN